ncbi:MAG: hypothetical protein KF832_10685 [Caldilineaceae bacterium]|nr:hypothetical protein [Caldilineaceae bacterium]
MHEERNYAETLGERKTFCFEEAFLFYLLAYYLRPSQVVEIGVQYGRSTRRIVDILHRLEVESHVTCFDVVDELKFVSHHEVALHIHDVTPDFSQVVLDQLAPTIIYLDARPYPLLHTVVSEFIQWSRTRSAALLIHDCSPSLFNPRMLIDRNDYAAVTSETGVWERHVLAEVLGAPNSQLDDLALPDHHLRIFGTPHGLAILTSQRALTKIKEQSADLA